jgi:hypothetical protein
MTYPHPHLKVQVYEMNRRQYASIREAARVLDCDEAEVAGRVPVTQVASRRFVELAELEKAVSHAHA